MQMIKPIKVLMAKPGLDGHDRGIKVVSRGLTESGFEVIYAGLWNTPEMIVETAIQEDVDVIGLSILSGAHDVLIPAITGALEGRGLLENVVVLVGGTIPLEDFDLLKRSGVDGIFIPGTTISEIAVMIKRLVKDKIGIELK
ncbi:MAG: cobalamin B12-binding domain-containing protein [Candidatus Methanolliviera hydrocarbonicum]|uniref:Cobalamin B12-binding domain-containing protein n=1 Tax=Candidatus Methanolliviera hydrocarbonicum TaxID=2491085 RepID=A0A520KYD2_9EURY|nr:MAG: cobalamin B12-binding domain-containing protein [Candidatus Methanolliviera hydrocarbonicum]